nr:MAG TPA: hypothetical protein [Caudoviricetes sp.]
MTYQLHLECFGQVCHLLSQQGKLAQQLLQWQEQWLLLLHQRELR